MEEGRTLDDVLNEPTFSDETKEKLKEVEGLLRYEVLTEHLYESIPLLFPVVDNEDGDEDFRMGYEANMRLFHAYETRGEIKESDWQEMVTCYGISMATGNELYGLADTIWPMLLYTLYLKDPGIRTMWPDLLPEGIVITLGGRTAEEVDQTLKKQIHRVSQDHDFGLRPLACYYAVVRYLLCLSEEDATREEMHMAGIDILGWELEKKNPYALKLVNFLLKETRNLLS